MVKITKIKRKKENCNACFKYPIEGVKIQFNRMVIYLCNDCNKILVEKAKQFIKKEF
jgi:transposase-like protein